MACGIKTMHDMSYGLVEQTTWGTAEAGSSTFVHLRVEPAEFDPDVRYVTLNSVSGYRDLNENDLIHHVKGAAPTIQFKGPIKTNDLALFLYGVIQNVSEAATTPFAKTYTFGSTQPDFSTGAGEFFTIAKKRPTATASQSVKDAICSKLVLVWEPETDGGIGMFTADMVGRGAVDDAYDMSSATLTENPITDLFYFHDLKTFTVDGNNLDPLRIEVEIGNTPAFASVDTTTGEYKCIALTKYYCTVRARVKWDSNAETTRQEAKTSSASTKVPMVMTWGTSGQDGYLNFALNVQPGPAVHEDADINAIDFTFQCVRDTTSGSEVEPITITLSDAVDRSW